MVMILPHPLIPLLLLQPIILINNRLGCSLMDETFPQNQQIYLPELQDQEAVSALTSNSTASAATGPFAWLQCKRKFAFLNPQHTLFIINLSIYIFLC